MEYRIIIIEGGGVGRIEGIRIAREALALGLKEAKVMWDRIHGSKVACIVPALWGFTHLEVSHVFTEHNLQHVYGTGVDPHLDPFECAGCGDVPCTWIDKELFLDPEHIEVFGGKLLCSTCMELPMGELLPLIESRVRPPSLWDRLMERKSTCLT